MMSKNPHSFPPPKHEPCQPWNSPGPPLSSPRLSVTFPWAECIPITSNVKDLLSTTAFMPLRVAKTCAIGGERLDLDGRNDPPLGVDVERPAGDDRQPRVARRIENGQVGRQHDLVTGNPVGLHLAPDTHLDRVARGQVIQAAEDVPLDVVVSVDDGIAVPKRG